MIHRFVLRDRTPASLNRLLYVVKGVCLTEKTMSLTQLGQYTFHVSGDANKFEIKQAVESIFDVQVVDVNTLTLKGKEKRFRGRVGQRKSMKKAIVTLKDGQNIDLGVGVGG
jgi:large subunit ribosomal protein L23